MLEGKGRRTVQLSVLSVLLAASFSRIQSVADKTIHTVFTTECNGYFNWQALAIYHSHQKAGQKGPVTRLLSCTEDQLKFYKDVDGIPTHIAPSWSINPRTGDAYSGINKPVAVKDWLEKAKPSEDYILIIDSDTIMREGFEVDEMGIKPGWAVSGFYGYLKGVSNELANKHIPGIPPRNDTLAGPYGRKSDQVGGFTFMSKADLQRMAADWVSITEDVRADPDAWTLSGDVFTKNPGDKPWIAEMYGYSYAAAKADVWHHTNDRVMLYPGYLPLGIHEPPKVLHYGIEYKIADPPFAFDKHWYQAFDALQCPPWQSMNEAGRPTGGLFPHPPHPSKLKSLSLELLRDLLAIETMATLNEALCLRHLKACPPSQELNSKCHEVFELSKAVAEAQKALITAPGEEECSDNHKDCAHWADIGECEKNARYMQGHCKLSCKLCGGQKVLAAPVEKPPKEKVPENIQGVGKVHVSKEEEPHEAIQASSKTVDVPKLSLTDLLRNCHSNTRMTMAQVKECMELAKQGKAYTPPPAVKQQSAGRQARPNSAGEELRKASPAGEKGGVAGAARRLSEGARGAEGGVWDGEHKVLALSGEVLETPRKESESQSTVVVARLVTREVA